MHKLMSFYYKYQVAISLSLSLRQQSSHLKRYIGRDPSLSALGAEVFFGLEAAQSAFLWCDAPSLFWCLKQCGRANDSLKDDTPRSQR